LIPVFSVAVLCLRRRGGSNSSPIAPTQLSKRLINKKPYKKTKNSLQHKFPSLNQTNFRRFDASAVEKVSQFEFIK
jgi:hypothetical protein